MLFNKKTKKIMKIAYAVLGVFIIISMILLYIPSLWQ